MPPLRITPAICATLLFALLSGPLLAQGEGPAIRLTSVARPAFETVESSVALEGTAVADGGLANILWVNQFEQRGRGTWAAGTQTTTWTISDIPLHLGVNLLAVTAVDGANRNATVHLAVNRKTPLGVLPPPALKIGTGIWQNRPIVYQLWKGEKIVDGDIILDPAALAKTASPVQSVAKGAVSPDGFGISYTSQLWPLEGGVHVVPYERSDSGNPNANLTAAISDFNAAFMGLVHFQAHAGETDYVSIVVDATLPPGEGMSNVGISSMQPNKLDCNDSCTEATWLHEMGHTVGLMHEHQRPDRDTYITLNLANADLPNVPGNFTLVPFDYQTLGLYDYASIMHYGAFDFSKAGLPVLESIPAGIPLSNDTGYSAGDVDQVERLYGAVPSEVTVTTNPPGLSIIVDGVTYTAPHTFPVALHSSLTLSLPPDPQYPSPLDGSAYGFGNWNDKKARSHTVTITPGAGTVTAPATAPAVTVYEANFIHYQPLAFMSPAAWPTGSGTVHVVPAAKAIFGGTFFADRTLVKLTLTQEPGFSFYDWYNMPFPPSDNPKSFYIQYPLTAAQAVSMATTAAAATASGLPLSPVTIIGETITGPNTWNPPLTGTVDDNFAFLPTGFTPFYDDDDMGLWDPGTRHKVSVNQTESPVTTNVYYNWNSWSDKGKIMHNFLAPTTGSRKVTASFTPFYASYTSTNSGCGSVTTFPAGVNYPPNSSFSFYEDGTAVSATANPPSGMIFIGWTGSLTGDTNPSPSAAIDDQFVPIGNFNLTGTTAPLAVTSLVPAIATARSTGLKLTINGTGFTSGTFVDWNGNPRTPEYVSPTELTVQLQAGDLANPGGQDVFLGNSTGICAVYAEASFTVKEDAAP
jgi:hypothetical protein